MAKATIKEVAAEAKVSTATVSRVLNENGYVSEGIKERVWEAVAKLNYQPSAVARSLKQDRTYMIGVIVPDISNPYFMGISRGIEDVVGAEGFQLMFCSSDENPAKEGRLLQLLQEKRVDAIVLATSGGNDEAVGRIADAGMPIVLMDRKLEAEAIGRKLDLVAEDNAEGAGRLTRKLVEDGHVRIGVVSGPARVDTARERLAGVMQTLTACGLEPGACVYHGSFTMEDGIEAVRRFLQAEAKPTAIVSLNNQMSLGVLLEIVRSGLKIPEEMAVASFGEVKAAGLLRSPGIYYIDQHPYDMGVRAGEILLRRIRKEAPAEPVVAIFRNEVSRMG